jgi:hypothetical protein
MASTTTKNGDRRETRTSGRITKTANGDSLKIGTKTSNGSSPRKRKNADIIEATSESKKIKSDTDSSPPKKQWIVNAFAMQSPGHLNPGLFKYPGDAGRKYNDIKSWISLAKKLEDAKFHAIFFADVLGGYDVYKGPANLHPTIPAAAQFPINDPLYAVSASMFFPPISLTLLTMPSGCCDREYRFRYNSFHNI